MKIELDPLKKFTYNQIQNHSFSFVLLNDKLQALHTPFMCKDYLQDLFWAEYTQAPDATVYGLTWGRGAFSVERDRFPLAVLGGKYNMREHAPYLLEFLNIFEAPLGIPPTTINVPENTEDAVLVCWMGKAWTVSGPMLSAYTSLIRLAGAYKGGDPVAYLDSINKPVHDPKTYQQVWKPEPAYMVPDISRMTNIFPKLKALLAGMRPPAKWTDSTSMGAAHNYGIMGCSTFPVVK